MIRFLFKKEIGLVLLCTLLFCSALFFYKNKSFETQFEYEDYAQAYMETYFNGDKESFYEQLMQDHWMAEQKMMDILNLVGYEGEVIESDTNSYYGQYILSMEILQWQMDQENKPGLYTPTVSSDSTMLYDLNRALRASRNLDSNIANNLELLRREIKRQKEGSFQYSSRAKAYQEEFSSINQDFPLIDPSSANFLLQFLENDTAIFLLLALLNFGTFASLIQKKRANVVAISKIGMRTYAHVVAMMINTLVYGIFILMLLFIVGR